jgi:hypothetical protein
LLSRHAVARYVSRVKPGIAPDVAERELTALVADAQIHPAPPAWAVVAVTADGGYLFLSDDLVAPLIRRPSGAHYAVTLLVRGALNENERQWRSQHKRYARGSRAAPKASKPKGGRPRVAPSDEW